MPIELICRACGARFEATRAELLKGPATYRLCERCRASEETEEAPDAA